MRRLICRYIHQTKKQLRQDGVNEDDLLEIKQDISSLRSVSPCVCACVCVSVFVLG